jgi:hypothetical protein
MTREGRRMGVHCAKGTMRAVCGGEIMMCVQSMCPGERRMEARLEARGLPPRLSLNDVCSTLYRKPALRPP